MNVLPLGQYVADVTPAESPVSWAALGGGAGLQELEAQAVAARSYVMSTYGSLQGYFGYADICDSTACQDYPGIADENTTTDTAVTATANVAVLMPCGASVARTQYSSSSGGYTAGGTSRRCPMPGTRCACPGRATRTTAGAPRCRCRPSPAPIPRSGRSYRSGCHSATTGATSADVWSR